MYECTSVVCIGVCGVCSCWCVSVTGEAKMRGRGEACFFMAEDLCLLGNSLSSTPAEALRPHYSHACTHMHALPTTSLTNPHVDTWMHKSKHTECNPATKTKSFCYSWCIVCAQLVLIKGHKKGPNQNCSSQLMYLKGSKCYFKLFYLTWTFCDE